VIHFDVHGAVLGYDALQEGYETDQFLYQARYGRADIEKYEGLKAFLFLEGEKDDQADPVEAGELAALLTAHQVPIAVLNACQSGKQVGARETSLGSRLMQAGVQGVLAMGYSVTVSAAELFMRTLYPQVFAGRDLAAAIRRARLELHNRKDRRAYFSQVVDLEDWLLPVVYQNQALSLAPRPFTPEEGKVFYERQAASYVPPMALWAATWISSTSSDGCCATACCWCAAWGVRARPRCCTTWATGGRLPTSWARCSISATTRRRGRDSRS
jgi:hypothetical protein